MVDARQVLGTIRLLNNENGCATTRRVAQRIRADQGDVQKAIDQLLEEGVLETSDQEWFTSLPKGSPRYWPTGEPPTA
jgi:predicted transcriptional regulator